MKVSTILRQKGTAVESIAREVPLRDAVARLSAKRIGALVVLDEERCVAGVLAESDVVRVLAVRGAAALGDAVHTAVARPLVTSAPGGDLVKHQLESLKLEVGVLRDYARMRR